MSSRIVPDEPPEQVRVMFDKYSVVAAKVLAAPNVWHLVAAGKPERRRVFSQTAHLVRKGGIPAFAIREDGKFEVRVFTDPKAPEDTKAKMHLRWVPHPNV